MTLLVDYVKRAKRSITRSILARFLFWERLRLHITPVHFYSPIPDTRELGPDVWSRESAMVGVDMREDKQIALLDEFFERFYAEYDAFPRNGTNTGYSTDNDSFRAVDGEILYCMIRDLHPKSIIEIGSGMSSLLIAQAVARNEQDGAACCYTVIDPFPSPLVLSNLRGLSHLLASKVEDVPVTTFTGLGENDILFIDSSHALRTGGDVWFEYLEVLPRLQQGVVVHIHDIFLPGEYPEHWVKRNFWFWNEQYLLQAFLAFNSAFEVLWGGSYMNLRHQDRLRNAFRSYQPGRTHPGSLWMRRVS